MRLARRLYEARKRLVQDLELSRIAIGGRIPGYARRCDAMTARECFEAVIERRLNDPVLTAQLAHGFKLRALIPDYDSSDEDSAGYANHLVEWRAKEGQPTLAAGGAPGHVAALPVHSDVHPVERMLEPLAGGRHAVETVTEVVEAISIARREVTLDPPARAGILDGRPTEHDVAARAALVARRVGAARSGRRPLAACDAAAR